LVLVLLTGIHAGPARIAGAHIEDESRTESVCQAPAVIPARGTALGRAGLSDRSRNRYPLFGIAEEKIVSVSEAVIYSHLITVRVVDCGPGLDEVVRLVPRNKRIGRRRIRLEELLHRRKDQRLRNLVAGRADGLILLLLRVHRQRIARRVTPERITH